jgi:hypothetical protein
VQANNKALTFAGLYFLDGDESHIGNTILDGEQQHPLLTVDMTSLASNVNIIGLTFRNGRNGEYSSIYRGGAVVVRYAILTVSHCSFYNNRGIYGGGLYTRNSEVYLSENSIRNNKASMGGGGLYIIQTSGYRELPVVFNPTDLNSIYGNFSVNGADFYLNGTDILTSIVADTLSVEEYDHFYNVVKPSYAPIIENLFIQADHETLPRIASDLYVAPWGDDANDGLTAQTPLASLWWACSIIAPTEQNTLTVHLLPGEYLASASDYTFPVYTRDYTTISGESPEATVINCEQTTVFIVNQKGTLHARIENLTVKDSRIGMETGFSYPILVEPDMEPNTLELENVIMYQAYEHPIDFAYHHVRGTKTNFYINNCQFGNPDVEIVSTQKSVQNTSISSTPGGIVRIMNSKFYNQNEPILMGSATPCKFDLINCLFDSSNETYLGNEDVTIDLDYIYKNEVKVDANIINNTFYGNHPVGELDGIIVASWSNYLTSGNTINIYNNVMIDNFESLDIHSIYIDLNYGPYATNVNVGYNLIPGGESTVSYPNWDVLNFNYEDTNLDTIPHFTGYGKNRFMLDSDSPCIDAGTLNLPEGFEMPETDLAGNPRVHGNSIDIGCYEWQGNVADFTMQAHGNTFPMEVEFTPVYNFPIDTIAWDLDLDGTIDSYEMNPVWIYPDFNQHNVGMYLNDGEAIEVKMDCINPTTPVVEEENIPPLTDELLACYPNPIRINSGYVVFKYNVEHVGKAELQVFNIKGQLVRSIVTPSQKKGKNTIFWHMTDSRGVHVASGVYLYKLLQNGKEIGTGKITVIKN